MHYAAVTNGVSRNYYRTIIGFFFLVQKHLNKKSAEMTDLDFSDNDDSVSYSNPLQLSDSCWSIDCDEKIIEEVKVHKSSYWSEVHSRLQSHLALNFPSEEYDVHISFLFFFFARIL